MGDFIFQNGEWFRPWAISFSKMENDFVLGRFHFPKWRAISSMGDFIFQNGERFRPWRISFSKMEGGFSGHKMAKMALIDAIYPHRIIFSVSNGQFFINKNLTSDRSEVFARQNIFKTALNHNIDANAPRVSI